MKFGANELVSGAGLGIGAGPAYALASQVVNIVMDAFGWRGCVRSERWSQWFMGHN